METNNNYNSKQKINYDHHREGEGNMYLFEKNWFEKNPIENKEIPVAEYVRYLVSFDAGEIFRSLGSVNAWSNGVDYIGGYYTSKWELKEMVIGIFYSYEGEYHIESLSMHKYLDLLLQLRNQYAIEHPEYTALEAEYQSALDTLNGVNERGLYK